MHAIQDLVPTSALLEANGKLFANFPTQIPDQLQLRKSKHTPSTKQKKSALQAFTVKEQESPLPKRAVRST